MGKGIFMAVIFGMIFLGWQNKDDKAGDLEYHMERYHPEARYEIEEKDGIIYVHLENKIYCELFPGGVGLPGIEIFK